MTKHFSTDAFTLARQASGLSQTALASASRLSQARISRIEVGTLTPSDDEVERLAAALGVPVPFLFQTVWIKHETTDRYHRAQKTAPVGERTQNGALLFKDLLRIDTLLKSIDHNPSTKIDRMDLASLSADGLSAARAAAIHVRRMTGHAEHQAIRSMSTLAENVGALVLRIRIPFNWFMGETLIAPDRPPVIFINDNMPEDRCRFTLAHELAHVFTYSTDVEHEAITERLCDAFAAELLCPIDSISLVGKPPRLSGFQLEKRKWGISMQALIMSMANAGRISDDDKRRLMIQISARGMRKNEPDQPARETPTMLSKIVGAHLAELKYSENDLAELLHMSADELRLRFTNQGSQIRIRPRFGSAKH